MAKVELKNMYINIGANSRSEKPVVLFPTPPSWHQHWLHCQSFPREQQSHFSIIFEGSTITKS
jgi:hypothetical protein